MQKTFAAHTFYNANLSIFIAKNIKKTLSVENGTNVNLNKNVRLSSLKLRAVTNGDELLNDKKFRNLRNIEVIKSNVSQMIDVSGFSYLEKLNLAENGLKQVPPLPASIIALNMSFNPLQRWCLN